VYAVPEPGPVLVYPAEDALLMVRQRLEGMARHRGLDLGPLEIHVITAPVLRLDREPDRARLRATTRQLRPRLLLLDPLVRLHGIDENHAGEVAELLAYFRALQRQLDLSVVLVHHTRKNAVGGVAAGLGLRGSSDIHAFGDSNQICAHPGPVGAHQRAPPAPLAAGLFGAESRRTRRRHLEVVRDRGPVRPR
jgi:RecA-family ATPase